MNTFEKRCIGKTRDEVRVMVKTIRTEIASLRVFHPELLENETVRNNMNEMIQNIRAVELQFSL